MGSKYPSKSICAFENNITDSQFIEYINVLVCITILIMFHQVSPKALSNMYRLVSPTSFPWTRYPGHQFASQSLTCNMKSHQNHFLGFTNQVTGDSVFTIKYFTAEMSSSRRTFVLHKYKWFSGWPNRYRAQHTLTASYYVCCCAAMISFSKVNWTPLGVLWMVCLIT